MSVFLPIFIIAVIYIIISTCLKLFIKKEMGNTIICFYSAILTTILVHIQSIFINPYISGWLIISIIITFNISIFISILTTIIIDRIRGKENWGPTEAHPRLNQSYPWFHGQLVRQH